MDDKLSLIQRGILITILLLKDKDPKLTLAKFKAKVIINRIKYELIDLQNKGYIKWTGYNRAIKSLEDETITPEVFELFQYINKLLRTNYKTSNTGIASSLRARLEDYSVSDIKKVFANRYMEWKDDTMMSKHLNPNTILRPSKFPKYYEETIKTKVGTSYVNADEIDLKKGDIITYSLSKKLVLNDVYAIKVYTIRNNKRIGNGQIFKQYGKDIKSTMNSARQSEILGRPKELEIIYNGE